MSFCEICKLPVLKVIIKTPSDSEGTDWVRGWGQNGEDCRRIEPPRSFQAVLTLVQRGKDHRTWVVTLSTFPGSHRGDKGASSHPYSHKTSPNVQNTPQPRRLQHIVRNHKLAKPQMRCKIFSVNSDNLDTPLQPFICAFTTKCNRQQVTRQHAESVGLGSPWKHTNTHSPSAANIAQILCLDWCFATAVKETCRKCFVWTR